MSRCGKYTYTRFAINTNPYMHRNTMKRATCFGIYFLSLFLVLLHSSQCLLLLYCLRYHRQIVFLSMVVVVTDIAHGKNVFSWKRASVRRTDFHAHASKLHYIAHWYGKNSSTHSPRTKVASQRTPTSGS